MSTVLGAGFLDMIFLLLGSAEVLCGTLQYRILRQKGTEAAGSGVYNKHKVHHPVFGDLRHPAMMAQLAIRQIHLS